MKGTQNDHKLIGNRFTELKLEYPVIQSIHLMKHIFSWCVDYYNKKAKATVRQMEELGDSGVQPAVCERQLPTRVIDRAAARAIAGVDCNAKHPSIIIGDLNLGATRLSNYFVNYRGATFGFHYRNGKSLIFAYPVMTETPVGWAGDYGRGVFGAADLLSRWPTLINDVCRICKEEIAWT